MSIYAQRKTAQNSPKSLFHYFVCMKNCSLFWIWEHIVPFSGAHGTLRRIIHGVDISFQDAKWREIGL